LLVVHNNQLLVPLYKPPTYGSVLLYLQARSTVLDTPVEMVDKVLLSVSAREIDHFLGHFQENIDSDAIMERVVRCI
jgi:hypothetical protein